MQASERYENLFNMNLLSCTREGTFQKISPSKNFLPDPIFWKDHFFWCHRNEKWNLLDYVPARLSVSGIIRRLPNNLCINQKRISEDLEGGEEEKRLVERKIRARIRLDFFGLRASSALRPRPKEKLAVNKPRTHYYTDLILIKAGEPLAASSKSSFRKCTRAPGQFHKFPCKAVLYYQCYHLAHGAWTIQAHEIFKEQIATSF